MESGTSHRTGDALGWSIAGGAVMSSAGVYKRCGCVSQEDGRRWGRRCPRLMQRCRVVCLPKREHSGRTIARSGGTSAQEHGALTLLGGLHAEWEATTGRAVVDGWLLTHDDGEHWSPSYLGDTSRGLVREADLPPIRFHALRHGAASLSLAGGN